MPTLRRRIRGWGGDWGGGVPSGLGDKLGIWRSVVSSPSWVRGGARPQTPFQHFSSVTECFLGEKKLQYSCLI